MTGDELREVAAFCREHDIAIVLEPDETESDQVETVLRWLQNQVQ
jgi:hypothetical protein